MKTIWVGFICMIFKKSRSHSTVNSKGFRYFYMTQWVRVVALSSKPKQCPHHQHKSGSAGVCKLQILRFDLAPSVFVLALFLFGCLLFLLSLEIFGRLQTRQRPPALQLPAPEERNSGRGLVFCHFHRTPWSRTSRTHHVEEREFNGPCVKKESYILSKITKNIKIRVCFAVDSIWSEFWPFLIIIWS